MFKAFFLWLFSVTLILGGIGFGFYSWVVLETQNEFEQLSADINTKVSQQIADIESLINEAETHSVLKAYLGLNKSGVPLLKSKQGTESIPSNVILQSVGSYLTQHTENSFIGVYLKEPFLVIIRSTTEAEKVDYPESELLAYFVRKKKLRTSLPLGDQYFIEDTVNLTFSGRVPKPLKAGDHKHGGNIVIQKKVPGTEVEVIGQASFIGWEARIEKILSEKHWKLMLGGVVMGLLFLLGGLLYHADGMSILEEKIGQFEYQFAVELEKQMNQKLEIERRESHRDISEGVHSVLKSPIAAIRSDVTMFLVGVTQEQLEEKANEINRQLDRIDKFIESLRASNNPGQISQARSNPKEILKALLPDWQVDVRKYGANLNETLHEVGEISLPERDVKAIFQNILKFEAERVKKNMYAKNVNIRLEQDQQGLHFSLVDNMNLEGEDISSYKDHMALAIAIGTLERNYCSLNMEEVPEGGLQMSFDLAAQEDQNLDSLTLVSDKLNQG